MYRTICEIDNDIDFAELQDKDSTLTVRKEYKKEDIRPDWSDISHLEVLYLKLQ